MEHPRPWILLMLVLMTGTLVSSSVDETVEEAGNTDEAGHAVEEGSGEAEEQHPEPKHEEAYHWTHEEMSEWPAHYKACSTNSKRQSPIDIRPKKAVYWDKLSAIDLLEESIDETHDAMTITNNGHSVGIALNKDVMVTGGMLADAYKVAGIHFHWGADDTQGSEHTVNGRKFPLEMHIVTFDSEKYDTVGDAVHGDNSLAVLGVFFQISDRNNTIFSNFIDHLREVKDTGTSTNINHIPVTDLLPAANHKYFRYLGSLTTPPCAESVIWTVFRETHSISSEQLAEFRDLMWGHDGHTSAMVNNYRPPLALKGRHVYRSFLSTNERPAPIPKPNKKPLAGQSTGGSPVQSASVLTVGLLAIISRLL